MWAERETTPSRVARLRMSQPIIVADRRRVRQFMSRAVGGFAIVFTGDNRHMPVLRCKQQNMQQKQVNQYDTRPPCGGLQIRLAALDQEATAVVQKINSSRATPDFRERTAAFRVTRRAHCYLCANLPGYHQTRHVPIRRWPSVLFGEPRSRL